MANSDNKRRKFMATTLQSVGLTALGGLLWSGYSDEGKSITISTKTTCSTSWRRFFKGMYKMWSMCVKLV